MDGKMEYWGNGVMGQNEAKVEAEVEVEDKAKVQITGDLYMIDGMVDYWIIG